MRREQRAPSDTDRAAQAAGVGLMSRLGCQAMRLGTRRHSGRDHQLPALVVAGQMTQRRKAESEQTQRQRRQGRNPSDLDAASTLCLRSVPGARRARHVAEHKANDSTILRPLLTLTFRVAAEPGDQSKPGPLLPRNEPAFGSTSVRG